MPHEARSCWSLPFGRIKLKHLVCDAPGPLPSPGSWPVRCWRRWGTARRRYAAMLSRIDLPGALVRDKTHSGQHGVQFGVRRDGRGRSRSSPLQQTVRLAGDCAFQLPIMSDEPPSNCSVKHTTFLTDCYAPGATSRSTKRSRKPSRLCHETAALTGLALGSIRVKPSSVTRMPSRSILQKSWLKAR